MSVEIQRERMEGRSRAERESELKPLNPSARDVVSTWWRPYGIIGRVGLKVGPLAAPFAVMWVMMESKVFDPQVSTEAFEMAAQNTATADTSLTLIEPVLVVTAMVIVVSAAMRIVRVK